MAPQKNSRSNGTEPGQAELPQPPGATASDLLEMPLKARTRRLLQLFDLRPRKSLSQNFLIDDAAADALAQAVDRYTEPDTLIIEIGAGLGALTVPLANLGRELAGFETDKHLIPPLQLLTEPFPNVAVRHCDITKEDLGNFAPGRRLAVVGNLPYHITGLLLRRLMEIGHRCDIIIVTVQTEVAERLVAGPGDEQYGVLSVFADYYLGRVEMLRRLGPGAFLPRPDVDSAALALHPLPDPAEAAGLNSQQEELLFRTIKAAFAHRRKTLRNSMAMSHHLDITKSELDEALADAGVDGGRRGEELAVQDFVRLAAAIHSVMEGE